MVYIKKNLPAKYLIKDADGNIDKFIYNREMFKDRMNERLSLPCISTSIKYGFTENDLKPLFDKYFEVLKSGVIPQSTLEKRNYKKKPK